MADPTRYRYAAPSGRRSPVLYNPARSSLPVGMNYTPYNGDVHVMPTSRHDSSISRAAGDYRTSNPVPITTTTYAVRKDRDPQGTTGARDSGRVHRSSTIDSSSKRPPIIVTTTHVPPGTHALASLRPESPSRDPYRSSEEGPYLTQPASSVQRSRSSTRAPFSAALDNDEYARLRERTGDERLHASRPAEYRPPRPTSLYHHLPPRHTTAIDYGDEGYEYTKPSDLARYDLDTSRPHRTRRESFDRNYYRPSVSVTTDIGRPYEQNDRRQRGPPPTTRGLDKVNRSAAAGIYDGPQIRMPVPPPVPLAPDPARRSGHHLVPGSPTSERRGASRTRPVSLYQEGQGWSHHDDPLYRGREDPLLPRDLREREREHFLDDSVKTRGFGIRTDMRDQDDYRRDLDPKYRDERRERRESRREFDDREPKRRSDEDWQPAKPREERREHDHRDHRTAHDDLGARHRKDPREDPVHDDEDRESKTDKIKDKVTTGLELAAASIGIGTIMKDKDGKNDKDDRSPTKRRKDGDDDRRRDSEDSDARGGDRHRPSEREPVDKQRLIPDDLQPVETSRDREYPRRERPAESATEARDRDRDRDRDRRQAEAKLNGETVEHSSRDQSASEDEAKGRRRTRRRRTSSAFNPNDAAGIMALKAQLAASEDKEKGPEKPTIREPSPSSSSAADKRESTSSETQLVATGDDARGRELVPPPHEERQVRVVSPPREKDDRKPIKGILKQPSSKFPEEPNPVREGVAPHKDDKTKADVPSGARWTKINRQLVNPEALTIGKERFEVRDDFVIVLRVLSKEEIQAYAAATAQLRGMFVAFPRFSILHWALSPSSSSLSIMVLVVPWITSLSLLVSKLDFHTQSRFDSLYFTSFLLNFPHSSVTSPGLPTQPTRHFLIIISSSMSLE
ncbi:hypothetical protein QBC33DRAFT_204580 [Phialemonium atrogriseum]|uniref:DUF8035 domain-containing protein n=1 Tax=Phialemonium atrogriseum TaxID=1093897 RepID=A0AAJ0BT87_9PEZI|nr:uncharacterized protein QBC33DRAFT_204580 [Phialemonium atrogriseum]KAK1764064.1 hypothetical protein QBC33DRAFT_204580 [Phialemonium atrogriseum]